MPSNDSTTQESAPRPVARMLKYSRLAALGMCVAAGVALIAIWIRSYFHHDVVTWGITDKRGLIWMSVDGKASINFAVYTDSYHSIPKWSVDSYLAEDGAAWLTYYPIGSTQFGFFLGKDSSDSYALVLPYWFLLLLTAGTAGVLYFKRFSLRMLLATITLFAVVSGILAATNSKRNNNQRQSEEVGALRHVGSWCETV